MLFYYKGNNAKMGDNSDKKKNMGHLFFMRNPYIKVQTLAYMVLNLCYAHESNKWPKNCKGP